MDAEGAHVGRVAHLSVRDWLAANASRIRDLPYVLVSSIDSDSKVSDMRWATARRLDAPAWALSLSPLVISGASIVDLLSDDNLFTGFDELWIPTGLPIAQPPDEAYLVAPRELDTEAPAAVLAWLEVSECRLGVGDGYGMNYAVRDLALGRDLGLD
jgi:hypothetical protein